MIYIKSIIWLINPSKPILILINSNTLIIKKLILSSIPNLIEVNNEKRFEYIIEIQGYNYNFKTKFKFKFNNNSFNILLKSKNLCFNIFSIKSY